MKQPSSRSLIPSLLLSSLLLGCGLMKASAGPLGRAPAPAGGDAAATPSPGRTAAAGRPTWCDDYSYPASTSFTAGWFDELDVAGMVNSDRSAEVFGEAVCATAWDDRGERDKLLALRKRWMAAAGYDERDFAVVAGEAKGYVEDGQDLTAIAGPVGQVAPDMRGTEGLIRLDELGARASMVARFQVVSRCLEASLAAAWPEDAPLLRAVLCTRDRLDVAKAYAEIEAAKGLNPRTRKDLRRMVKQASDVAATASAWVQRKAKGDPGIAKLVAIADAQFAEWASPSPTRRRLSEQLEAMEAATAANKRSAFAGCETTTRAAWEGVLASATLPRVPNDHAIATFVDATLGTAEGYLAYAALRLCAANDANDGEQGQFVGSNVTRRGPRTGSVAAWLGAGADITFDDRDLALDRLLAEGLGLVAGAGDLGTAKGVIAKLADDGRMVEISFKRVTAVVDDCVKWRSTGRIQSISEGGAVNYQQVCTGWGKVTRDLTASSVRTARTLAQGLAVGMALAVTEDGLPLVATASATSSKPVWVLGGAVK